MKRQVNADEFLVHVAKHRLTVLRDDGVYRHIRFSDGSSNRQFDLLTWPGHLCFTGDMGTFVFRRLEDMFTFFRPSHTRAPFEIDRGYWAEKVIAPDRHKGTEEWSPDRFRENVEEEVQRYIEARSPSDEELAELREALNDEVLSCDEDQHEAMTAAMSFRRGEFHMADFWDHGFKAYTYHFEWCCFAIQWGIGQYDAAKKAAA